MEKSRVILHVDMDAFFAAVEVLDNPRLRGKAIAVGGDSERGVVTTCSYEARKFGVKSAMPIYIAKSLCKDLKVVPIRHFRYREISDNIFKILSRFSNNLEKVSIDEAYIDISDKSVNPIRFAFEIKKTVKKEIGLTLSIGISYNKFFAKLASDWNKPDGIMEITKKNYRGLLNNLNVRKIHGLGEKGTEFLHGIGIEKIGQMYDLSIEFLKSNLGKGGEEIYHRIRGVDNREVETSYIRKSYGKEITLKTDVFDKNEIFKYIDAFADKIFVYLSESNSTARTVVIKVKTNDFQIHTKSKTISSIYNKSDIYKIGVELFMELGINRPIRLIGLSATNLNGARSGQISLF